MTKEIFSILKLSSTLQDKLILESAEIINNVKDNNKFAIVFKATNPVLPEEMLELLKKVKLQTEVEISARKLIVRQPDNFEYEDHIVYSYLYALLHQLDPSISMSTIIIEKHTNEFKVFFTTHHTNIYIEKHKASLAGYLRNFGTIDRDIIFIWDDTKFDKVKLQSITQERLKQIERKQSAITYNSKPRSGFDKIRPKKEKDTVNNGYFEGEVFHYSSELKKNDTMLIVSIGLQKKGEVVYAKQFLTPTSKYQKYNIGEMLRVYGQYKYNGFSNQFELSIKDIEVLHAEEEPEVDDEFKRAELHVHTKMSAGDGVSDPEEYFKLAKKLKINALAFTDHNSVQSFPLIQKVSGKYPDVKPIYGCEFDVIDDINLPIVRNPIDQDIKNSEFIFFDLETTGLYPEVNEIIEFGALKYKNGQFVDKLEFFVKPQRRIPDHIIEHTGITNEMVEGANSIKKGIADIREFFGNAILVAHNAEFDMSYIQSVLRQYKFPILTNPVIDTMKLSWLVNPNLKKHSLGYIAGEVGVMYDENIAHRAIYDCDVLAKVFDDMQFKLYAKNIRNISQINDHFHEVKKNIFANHVNVIVKEQKGLTQLYKLISASHTTFFNQKREQPLLPLSFLLENREGLLIGSSCSRGLAFNSVLFDSVNIESIFKMFDYIEIFPPSVYANLIETKQLQKDELKHIMKKVIARAEQFNVPVVVSSNAHYSIPEKKIARDVYIIAKGLGGRAHALHNYKNPLQDNPDQHLRNTDELMEKFTKLVGEEKANEIVRVNSKMIADQVEIITPLKEGLFTPKIEGSTEKLKELIEDNIKKFYGDNPHPIITARIQKEYDSIFGHNFGVIYFLASLAVKKSLDYGYLVGSRGSVGSSFVATMAEITEVNPLEPHYICRKCKFHEFVDGYEDGYDLPQKRCPKCDNLLDGEGHNIPFETFLGFEGDKVPDIDLNFAEEQQPLIHDFIREYLGYDQVYRAGTIMEYAEKTAYGLVRNYLELHHKADETSRGEMNYLTHLVDGTKKSSGQHPGGLIVIPKGFDIHDFTPINYPGNDSESKWKTTHFKFEVLHDNLLKLDLLGHVDPQALKMLGDLTGYDCRKIRMDDQKVISIFNSRDALGIKTDYLDEKTGAIGIPEFGTPFVRKMLTDTQPKLFSELIKISGLSHGTGVYKGNAEELIKNNIAPLKDVISVRDGIMTYLISKGLDNKTSFNITESVRKGKGLKPEWDELMLKHGVPQWYVDSCKKIQYMFPKAHATAYVMMAYRIAWYKINYPIEYYATYLSVRKAEINDVIFKGPKEIIEYNERIKKAVEARKPVAKKELAEFNTNEVFLEMFSRGFSIEKISLEKSNSTIWIINKQNNSLIPPISILDGVGEVAAKKFVEQRTIKKFTSLEDFKERSGFNKTVIEKLKGLGLLNNFQKEETKEQTIFDLMK